MTRVVLTSCCSAEFSDASAKFYCRIYYAEEFHKMREEIMESSEEDFVRSLSHCVNWQARGGKSGAVFYATEGLSIDPNQPLRSECGGLTQAWALSLSDDRFILKQMPRLEVQSFLDFAPHYFTYITGAVQQKVRSKWHKFTFGCQDLDFIFISLA